MTKEKLLNYIFNWGVLAAIIAVAFPDLAFAAPAGTSIGTAFNTFTTTDLTKVTPVISGVSYIGGAVLGISGALKLKQHAENPAQEKMAPGLARLLAGGGLIALPFLIGTMAATTHFDTKGTYEALAPVTGG